MSAVNVLAGWSLDSVGLTPNYVLRHGSFFAHRVRDDGVYAILEFGCARSSAQAFADHLNAAGHVGQTVPHALCRVQP